MYPVIRMFWQLWQHRNSPPLPLTGTHVSQHYCLPWDIDLWRELNNGRTLTLFDLGRIPLVTRVGLIGVLRRKRWGMAIAGASVRYRRRVRMFDRVEMRSRLVGWDARFIYIEQSMWSRDGQCANHILCRCAVTGRGGIVPLGEVLAALGQAELAAQPLPGWVHAWIAAEDVRPWPPMQG